MLLAPAADDIGPWLVFSLAKYEPGEAKDCSYNSFAFCLSLEIRSILNTRFTKSRR